MTKPVLLLVSASTRDHCFVVVVSKITLWNVYPVFVQLLRPSQGLVHGEIPCHALVNI